MHPRIHNSIKMRKKDEYRGRRMIQAIFSPHENSLKSLCPKQQKMVLLSKKNTLSSMYYGYS